jgi:hypothetical protein
LGLSPTATRRSTWPRQSAPHCRHTLVDQTIPEYGAAQAAQCDDRLTGAGHRLKVRKILDTTHYSCRWSHCADAISRRTSSPICPSLISDRHRSRMSAAFERP